MGYREQKDPRGGEVAGHVSCSSQHRQRGQRQRYTSRRPQTTRVGRHSGSSGYPGAVLEKDQYETQRDGSCRSPGVQPAGDGEILDRRVQCRPNSGNWFGQTPLWWAADRGYHALVDLLLGLKSIQIDKADKKRHTPFFRAIFNDHRQVIDLFESFYGLNLRQ